MQATLPSSSETRTQDQSTKRTSSSGRLAGLVMIAIGVAAWWYNWHLASTAGEFYIKLCLLGPLGVFGGILVLLRPDWVGPVRSDSTRGHKFALIAVIGLMAIASGIDFYLLVHHRSPRSSVTVTPWSPKLGTPPIAAVSAMAATPAIAFQAQTYCLGSFNQQRTAMWEFVPADENINDWKTLLTIIDRPDARTREELDRLAEGIMSVYQSQGARILLARTMREESGAVFNYLVAAFDEPDKQRFELDFVKVELGAKNAAVVVYGVRVTDPKDYRTKAKDFLDMNSHQVGRALGELAVPDVSKLPRRVF
ncbi:MAG: hypothetical protein LAP38_12165 [Acidobacteriia bacterium]|nr:hypothetical protein [Terriglobia bacterium]